MANQYSKKYPDKLKSIVIEENKTGATVNELSEKYGVNIKTLYVWINKPEKSSSVARAEEKENKGIYKNAVAKRLFQRITVGSKLNLIYQEELLCKRKSFKDEVLNIHQAEVIGKSDRLIFIKDIQKSYMRGSIGLGDLISGSIRVKVVTV